MSWKESVLVELSEEEISILLATSMSSLAMKRETLLLPASLELLTRQSGNSGP